MINIIKRGAIYILITVLSLGFLYLIKDSPPLVPHGIYLASSEGSFTPTQGPLTVLNTGLPAGAKQVGIINMQMRLSGDASEAEEQQVMNAAKALASSKGASGIAINYFLASQGEGTQSYLLQATVFKT